MATGDFDYENLVGEIEGDVTDAGENPYWLRTVTQKKNVPVELTQLDGDDYYDEEEGDTADEGFGVLDKELEGLDRIYAIQNDLMVRGFAASLRMATFLQSTVRVVIVMVVTWALLVFILIGAWGFGEVFNWLFLS